MEIPEKQNAPLEEQKAESILAEGGEDKLNELKAWLFQENVRLQAKQGDLKRREDKLREEEAQLKSEIKQAEHRLALERKRLKQDEDFFEKKMDILKNGFVQLDLDRSKLEKEKLLFEAEKTAHMGFTGREKGGLAGILFQGVNNRLALKKRYKDLIKIFHPDNMAGDHEMVLAVNKIYEELKQDYDLLDTLKP